MSPEMNFDAAQVVEQASNQDILDWIEARKELARVKAKESALRGKIQKYFFTTPEEGTNYFDLGNGYRLKYVHKLSRKIDTALFTNLLPMFAQNGIDQNQLAEFKPELKVTYYKKTLSDEQRLIVNQCVTVSPAAGTLEFVPPKGTD